MQLTPATPIYCGLQLERVIGFQQFGVQVPAITIITYNQLLTKPFDLLEQNDRQQINRLVINRESALFVTH